MSETQDTTYMPANSLRHVGSKAAATTSATTSLLADSPAAREKVSPLCIALGLIGTQATARLPAYYPGHFSNKAATTTATYRLLADPPAARENVSPLRNAYGVNGTLAATSSPAVPPGH